MNKSIEMVNLIWQSLAINPDDDWIWYEAFKTLYTQMGGDLRIGLFTIGSLNCDRVETLDTYVSSRMRRLGAKSLDIIFSHVCQVATLPLLHRDPFVGVASPLGESNIASTSTDRTDEIGNSR
jgi:hypothetical protein